MNATTMAAVLAALTLTEIGRADPLDQWTWRNPVTGPDWLDGVVYGSNQFVAVGESGTILTSPDGVAWKSRNSGITNGGLYGIASGNGLFVAVGFSWDDNYGVILTSQDGIVWTSRPLGVTNVNGFNGSVFGNNLFVRSEEHTSELQSLRHLVCRLLLEK